MAQTPRSAQTRAATARPPLGGDFQSKLQLDTSGLDPAFEVQWMTESVLGADYSENLRMAMDTRGFVPVLASELPQAGSVLWPGQKREDTDVIRRGGLVLMKRPKEWGLEEKRDLAQQNAEALRSVTREFEEGVTSREGFERLPDGGVRTSFERPRGAPGAPFGDA